MLLRQRHPRTFLLGTLAALAAACVALTTAGVARPATTCPSPNLQPFLAWGDSNQYLLGTGGNFEGALTGWKLAGKAGVVAGNESFYVGAPTDSYSLALPTTASSVTTPMWCVTANTPMLRLFLRNNGLNGHTDGQLAFYVNFTGSDGKLQTVKIAGLKATTAWAPSQQIYFIQYIRTALQNGYAYVSFTVKPNDNHGSWQIDDFYFDPIKNH